MTAQVAKSIYQIPFKITFADGTFTVVDAQSTYEALQIGKTKSHLTPVSATKLTLRQAKELEDKIYSKPKW